jgi:hypothetical protein
MSTNCKGKEKEKLRYNFKDNEYSESSEEKKQQKRKEDARRIIAQARVNKSRYAWREENYEDNDNDMGALCFTRRVRKTRVPKGFRLPHDQLKYDGSQEPTLWLLDYLQAVQILGGNKGDCNAKFTAAPHRRCTVLAKYPTRRIYRKLGGTRNSICEKFSFHLQTPSVTGGS